MGHQDGESFYDRSGVHDRYTAHRAEKRFSPNYVMEEPAVLGEIGDPTNLRVLDLGCGDGAFGTLLLAAGARCYLGVDNSQRMIELAARALSGTAGRVELADIDNYVPDPGSVDLMTARLSLHYVADLDRVVGRAAEALAPLGRLILTVVHPIITSHDTRPAGPRTTWTVDNYFQAGPRVREWMGAHVTWQHRTIENYVAAVVRAGLTVTSLRECEPDPARFEGDTAELARRRRVPLFLRLNCRAPALIPDTSGERRHRVGRDDRRRPR